MIRSAALALALVAGLTLHGHPVGLGVTLTALALLALAARARWEWWALAAAFALVPTLRAAGWVQAIGIVGTIGFAFVAAGGFQTVGGAVRALGRGVIGLLPGPLVIVGPLVSGMSGRWGATLPAARGAALAAVLLIPFTLLFATADAAFAEWIETAGDAVPSLDDSALGRLAIVTAVLAVAGALALAAPDPRREPAGAGVIGRTEWLIALGALNALFASFVWLQVATLFEGHDYVRRTAGLTYSEYLHQGVWQLVAVAALTLAVLAAARRWTEREGSRDERLQLLLLGGLCVLTLVVLASAYSRLELYLDAYGMTRLRLLVQWAILFLAVLFALVLLAHRFPWFPRATVGLTGLAVLALAVTNPDGRIASTNLARFEKTGKLDRAPLRELSADAAGAIGCRPRSQEDGDGLAGFNLARHRARSLPKCA